jgi:hypothetical protein
MGGGSASRARVARRTRGEHQHVQQHRSARYLNVIHVAVEARAETTTKCSCCTLERLACRRGFRIRSLIDPEQLVHLPNMEPVA